MKRAMAMYNFEIAEQKRKRRERISHVFTGIAVFIAVLFISAIESITNIMLGWIGL